MIKTEQSYYLMLEKTHEYLSEELNKWVTIFNEDRKTDAGTPLRTHAQGRIGALVELRTFLVKMEKDYGER